VDTVVGVDFTAVVVPTADAGKAIVEQEFGAGSGDAAGFSTLRSGLLS